MKHRVIQYRQMVLGAVVNLSKSVSRIQLEHWVDAAGTCERVPCPQSDSNRHCADFKSAASARIRRCSLSAVLRNNSCMDVHRCSRVYCMSCDTVVTLSAVS